MARYIYRLDDITPNINWKNFNDYLRLFGKYKVVPLLGIVPDNSDKSIIVSKENNEFWKIIKDLYDRKQIEIAQHGCTHVQAPFNAKKIKCVHSKENKKTEFAGKSYNEQYNLISRGLKIMNDNGVQCRYWMSPSHTFDLNTLKALKNNGFIAVTNGIGLFPYKKEGLYLVPQIAFSPKNFCIGIITICLHINESNDETYKRIEKHLSSNRSTIRFSESLKYYYPPFTTILNSIFRISYMLFRNFKDIRKKKTED